MAWYNTSWDYRVKVTVLATKVDADLTDFPVYVDLSELPAGFHTNVNQTDGRDIRITKADGETEVPREVVFYDSTTDTGELHFKGDVLDATDVDFYVYYGNTSATEPAVTDTYGRNSVYDSNYIRSFNGRDATTATLLDSTGTANGTKVSANNPIELLGTHGYGQDFNGDYVNAGSALDNATAFTIEVIVSYDDYASDNDLFAKGLHNAGESMLFWRDETTTDRYGFLCTDNGASTTGVVYSAIAVPQDSALQHIVITFTANSAVNMFIDGVSDGNNPISASTVDDLEATGAFYIGNNSAIGTAPLKDLDGKIYLFRISNSNRGAGYATTSYNNLMSQSTFLTIGSEETPTATGTNMQINIGDSWKSVEAMKINIGDVWKSVASAKINIGDVWKDVLSPSPGIGEMAIGSTFIIK